MSHYENWVRNQRRLRSAGISNANIRDLERILDGTDMSIMDGLIELGVATGYLEESHLEAVSQMLGTEQDPTTGVWGAPRPEDVLGY